MMVRRFHDGGSMTETEYLEKIESAFAWIEAQVDGWNQSYDMVIETGRHGPVLETEFESGQKIITNAQAPTQQLWMASQYGAHHFVLTTEGWLDTRGAGLFEQVFASHASRLASVDCAPKGRTEDF
ncbi:iron donor protein CyaY [Betaproteobacteria bacterium LSUCC0115]|jgi:CyaY protein|nr:iron donor protein CyaY [Burkholderiales bacterium LSUCC0115]